MVVYRIIAQKNDKVYVRVTDEFEIPHPPNKGIYNPPKSPVVMPSEKTLTMLLLTPTARP